MCGRRNLATGGSESIPGFAHRIGFQGTPSGWQMGVRVMNVRNLSKALMLTVSVVLAGMFAFSGIANAEETPNNLSVPTIMVGGTAGNLVCGTAALPSLLIQPSGDPWTGYDVPGYYYVQKMHSWQAQCFNSNATEEAPVKAFGNWGDNLEGDAKLKVGAPIRVEIVLENRDEYLNLTTLKGYTVIKLENTLDRLSAYGHEAVATETAGFIDNPVDFGQATWLVHDNGITFSVQNLETFDYAVPPGTNPMAEINATGKVVYGYNLRVGVAGPYRIQFTSSDPVKFDGVDAGDQIDEHNVYIDINVVPGGGGGGKGGGGNPGGGTGGGGKPTR